MPSPSIPTWVYAWGPLLVLISGGYTAYLGRRSAKFTNKQVTQTDIIDQIQQERDRDSLVIKELIARVAALEKISRMATKFMAQQDMWITRVFDPAIHPVPPAMPEELKEV